MSPEELKHELTYFTGTEHWYKYLCGMLLTDGVKHFAEKAGAFWFLDIAATELMVPAQAEGFLHVRLVVKDDKADILADDGNDTQVFSRHINFTDAPEGEWHFYLTDGVMLLPSEY